MIFDLNCFLHLLHCLKEPSFSKIMVSFEEQNTQFRENFVNNPLLFIYELNVLNLYAICKSVCGKLLFVNIFELLIIIKNKLFTIFKFN